MRPTFEQITAYFSYDPETGVISRKPSGRQVGRTMGNGYVRVGFKGKTYPAHHIAHVIMTGNFPIEFMDHRNGKRADNRWVNLRPATYAENNQNMPDRRDNTSGYRGVYWSSKAGKWATAIQHQNTKYHLGYFDDPSQAFCVYQAAKASKHTFQPSIR